MPVIGDVFGLNTVYDKQRDNVDNDNFENWSESATYGYFVGGVSQPLIVVNTISRLDFSNETTSNPGKGFPSAIQQQASISSNYYGYLGGGRVPPTVSLNYSSTITRLDFSNEILSLPGNNLPTAVTTASATASNSYGYFGGGYFNPGIYYNTITRLDFSNETISLPGKNLPSGRSNLAGTSSDSYGYFGGGANPGASPSILDIISRIDFSNETVSDPGNNLPSGRYSLAGTSNKSYGYFGGGFSGSDINTISRLDFSNETTSNPGKNISTPKSYIAATSSNTYGYFGGGYYPTLINTISRLDFSTENVSDPSSGGLDGVRNKLSAVSGGTSIYRSKGFKTYGYSCGGTAPSTISTITRLDFSSETTSDPGNNLIQASNGGSGLSNNNYGYAVGGVSAVSPFYLSIISRLDFSNETVNSPVNRFYLKIIITAETSNNSYGYLAGGFTFGGWVSTIARLDFSSEVISSPTNNLSIGTGDGTTGNIMNASYGYFIGGYVSTLTPTTVNTIQRLDFSTENVSLPGNNLPTGIRVTANVSNNSYGYIMGGFNPPSDTNTIRRLDFSNETVSLPGKNLPVLSENAKGFYNSYYGYHVGGFIPTVPGRTCVIYRLDFSTENVSTPGFAMPQARASMIPLMNSN